MDFKVGDYVRLARLEDDKELSDRLGREGYIVKRGTNVDCIFGTDYYVAFNETDIKLAWGKNLELIDGEFEGEICVDDFL